MKYSEILTYNYTDILICPVCKEGLVGNENRKSLVCKNGHCFDIAAKGYVNLAPRSSGGGDSKEAVASRSAFLDKDFYRPFANELCHLIKKYVSGDTLIDAGCGEGYYTDIISRECNIRAVGFDLSKWAVEHGASRAKQGGNFNVAYAVGGIFDLPVKDASADCVINLFAPCAEAEFSRVLRNGGILIVAGAGRDHLYGLKKAVYDVPYKNELRADLPQNMTRLDSVKVKFDITLESYEDKINLFAMTPYYYRTSQKDSDKLKNDTPIVTEVEFDIDIYQK